MSAEPRVPRGRVAVCVLLLGLGVGGEGDHGGLHQLDVVHAPLLRRGLRLLVRARPHRRHLHRLVLGLAGRAPPRLQLVLAQRVFNISGLSETRVIYRYSACSGGYLLWYSIMV